MHQYKNLLTGGMITSRRDFGKGLAAILAAGSAPAICKAALLGARGVAMGGGKSDSNPYDTDDHALSAMWDAEWNVAYKKHANNGQIANLCDASTPFVINSNGTLNSNYLAFNGLSATCSRNDFSWRTCECAFRLDSGRIVFYGCRKYQTSDNSSELMCISKQEYGGVFSGYEFCERNNKNTDYICRDARRANMTLSRLFNGSLYEDGNIITDTWDGNTWGNQSVMTIGGRVSTTAYDGAGRFYCLRLYSRNLTQAELTRNYQLDAERFYS